MTGASHWLPRRRGAPEPSYVAHSCAQPVPTPVRALSPRHGAAAIGGTQRNACAHYGHPRGTRADLRNGVTRWLKTTALLTGSQPGSGSPAGSAIRSHRAGLESDAVEGAPRPNQPAAPAPHKKRYTQLSRAAFYDVSLPPGDPGSAPGTPASCPAYVTPR